VSAVQAEIGVSWRKTTRCSVLECVEVAALPVDPGALTEAARQAPPIAASGIWSQVIARAGGRCQCPAKHHRSHRRARCEADTSTARLIAAPAVPNPGHATAAPAVAAVAELIAWCPSCWDETERDANRQARAAERRARRTGELAGALW
jgi:hypothetical protein